MWTFLKLIYSENIFSAQDGDQIRNNFAETVRRSNKCTTETVSSGAGSRFVLYMQWPRNFDNGNDLNVKWKCCACEMELTKRKSRFLNHVNKWMSS